MTPRFQPGQRVSIRMLACDASFEVEGPGSLRTVRDTHDVGTGIVLSVIPDHDLCDPEEESGRLYYIAVVEGRFDGHRNDLGQLACWDHELTILPGQHT